MRLSFKLHTCTIAAIALAAVPVLAQDNVEGPWGCQNGDIFGRSRSADIPLLFGTGTGAVQAWALNPTLGGAASDRPAPRRTELVFDATGNCYWFTTSTQFKISSASAGGVFRWNAKRAGGAGDYKYGDVIAVGSPIVGVDRVYALGGGRGFVGGDPATPDPMNRPAIAAFNKATGAFIWQAFLNETGVTLPWIAEGVAPTPVLYNGKLYVVGKYDLINGGVNVYQIDAATGVIDWTSLVTSWLQNGDYHGTMAFVPGAFTPNHGLFYQADSGAGGDGGGEVVGISIDPTPGTGGATFIWTADGGKVARSHVIYNPLMNRLYTHTWHDYGGEFYSFDPMTGTRVVNNNTPDYGHGYYDVGALDFDDATIVAGGFSGGVVRYTDDGTGTTTDAVYKYTDNNFTGCNPAPAGCANWFGELRTYGQLLQDCAGNTILITGTNSRVTADVNDPFCPDLGPGPYPCLTARVIVANLDASFNRNSLQDGALLIDNIVVEEGPDISNLTTVHTDNFETGYSVGAIAGQNGWVDDNAPPSSTGTQVQVINDPTGSGQGKVMWMDANGGGGGWVGAYKDITDATNTIRRVSWRQWRADTGDNVWIDFGAVPNEFAGSWFFQWDQSGRMYHKQAGGSVADSAPTTAGVWQQVTITYDAGAALITLDIDGQQPVEQDQYIDFNYQIKGLDFQLEGTAFTAASVPEDVPMVVYNTGIGANLQNNHTTTGGPVAGPDGKIYYFNFDNRSLIALRPERVKGDANCSGAFDVADMPDFALALVDPAGYTTSHPCSNILAAADMNNDGRADGKDVQYWVNCILNP